MAKIIITLPVQTVPKPLMTIFSRQQMPTGLPVLLAVAAAQEGHRGQAG
jgi:phosphoribosylcarboxyaminoimidazole (NCAIR) mutase